MNSSPFDGKARPQVQGLHTFPATLHQAQHGRYYQHQESWTEGHPWSDVDHGLRGLRPQGTGTMDGKDRLSDALALGAGVGLIRLELVAKTAAEPGKRDACKLR
ncbi:hypothetical protein TREES_T100013999 [Tupaia chinensis]|uniref:Uncharacterized protein n=1 Tax=Tupaia chinensis TaxID=246437 RepID=L9KQT4_TUPCH|nr:hypothetical protein TREES_T100013999 [Tupaia chinensis]